MKKIILIIGFLLLIGFSCFIFSYRYFDSSAPNNDTDIKIDSIKVEEEVTDEEIVDNTKEETIIIDENVSVKEDVTTESSIEPKHENNTTQKNPATEKNETVNKTDSKKEEVVKKEEKEETTVVEEQSKTLTVWEELGISEYDYYNKPMWSWARIDFSIKEYETYERTRDACIAKGEEYFEQGLGYSCTSINSYSGDYLGEMIKTF